MIVRWELRDGRNATASVPARMADQVGNPQILAWCLLEAVPRAACIEIWVNGRSREDKPDAVARPPKAENAPQPNDLVMDIATAIMLMASSQPADPHDGSAHPQTGAPPWLTRSRCTPRPAPQGLRGRAHGDPNRPPV